jgi:hypothetical protein
VRSSGGEGARGAGRGAERLVRWGGGVDGWLDGCRGPAGVVGARSLAVGRRQSPTSSAVALASRSEPSWSLVVVGVGGGLSGDDVCGIGRWWH